MSTQREQLSALVADVLGEQFELFMARIRAEVFERMHEMELRARAPNFQLTPQGELFCNGEQVGDVRPVFHRVVADVLSKAGHVKPDHGGDDAGDC